MGVEQGPEVAPVKLAKTEQCNAGQHGLCHARSGLTCECSCHPFNED